MVRDISREIQAERKNMNLVPEDKVEAVVYSTESEIDALLQNIKQTVGAEKITLVKVDIPADAKVEVKKV